MRPWRQASAIALLLLFAACAGGGGSGGGTGSPAGTAGSSQGGQPATDIASESQDQSNLSIIGAQPAQLRGARGLGTRVAVIDSGIDLDHPEFAGRITSSSIDIVTGRRASVDDQDGHGTHIAGIIAAAGDGKGVAGVAYKSRIMAIRAEDDDPVCASRTVCGFSDADVAKAIDHAVDKGADIINLSFGKEPRLGGLSDAYRAAIERAVRRDVLIVASAGNENLDALRLPADQAGQRAIMGRLLAVGAVDETGQALAVYSNRPGDFVQAEHFLVAPGNAVLSTAVGGGYETRSGTSQATAHVSGAAAALKSLFPNLDMATIARILRDTAVDLGPGGVDLVFGRGLVDLEAASRPRGRMILPKGRQAAGRGPKLSASRLELGSAFGDALSSSTALADTIALDGYGRAFKVDLSSHVEPAERDLDLHGLLVDERALSNVMVPGLEPLGLAADLAFRAAALDRTSRASSTSLAGLAERSDHLEIMRVSGEFGDGSQGVAWIGNGLDDGGGLAIARGAPRLFHAASDMMAPASQLVGRGYGGRFSHALGANTELDLAYFDGFGSAADDLANQESGPDETASARVLMARLMHWSQTTQFEAGWSALEEKEGLFGSSGEGALALGAARSHFFDLGMGHDLSGRVSLFAKASLAVSESSGEGDMVSDVSTVMADSYALGVVVHALVAKHDRLGLIFGQPLRVRQGMATLETADALTVDGRILRGKQRESLEPEGRELNLQLAYTAPIGSQGSIASWIMARHEAGHNADRDLDLALGMKLSLGF